MNALARKTLIKQYRRTEFVNAAEFLKLTAGDNKHYIKSTKFIKPKLGSGRFGKFEITWRRRTRCLAHDG